MSALIALDHVGLTVTSLDASTPFYTRLLGAEPFARLAWDAPYLGRVGGYDRVRLEGAFWKLPGGLTLELLEYQEPEPVRVQVAHHVIGHGHLAITTADVDADWERVRGLGSACSPSPVEIEAGPYAGGWVIRLRDPDGVSVELIQHPAGGVQLA